MKTLFVAGALGLGLFFTVSVSAQTPAQAKPVTVHKPSSTATKPAATQERDAKDHDAKAEAAKPVPAQKDAATGKPAATKAGVATAKPVSAEQKKVMAHPAKVPTVQDPQGVKATNSHPVKKAELTKPATK